MIISAASLRACFSALAREIGDVDIAALVAGTTTTFMPAITADGRIGAVRRGGDEADVAVASPRAA